MRAFLFLAFPGPGPAMADTVLANSRVTAVSM